jgi:hypothetical protein
MTFAYGIRNSFGMAIDPVSGDLWATENGEDTFDEINRVEPGFNSGWIQIMGPASRVPQYREIESTEAFNEDFPNLQQFRWAPENIAARREEALRRLFRLPGFRYSDPEFSWVYAIAPAAIGFAEGDALGRGFQGDLFMGLSVPVALGGPLFRFDLTRDRDRIAASDRVADNHVPGDLTESERFLIGANFGIVTDIKTAPNGNLYVVSLSNGAVYEVFSRPEGEVESFTTRLTGEEEVPGPGDPDGRGTATVTLNPGAGEVCFAITVANITLPAAAAHIHIGEKGVAGDIVVTLTPPDESGTSAGCVSDVDPALIQDILANPAGYYVNVHTEDFPAGAVRGQLGR